MDRYVFWTGPLTLTEYEKYVFETHSEWIIAEGTCSESYSECLATTLDAKIARR